MSLLLINILVVICIIAYIAIAILTGGIVGAITTNDRGVGDELLASLAGVFWPLGIIYILFYILFTYKPIKEKILFTYNFIKEKILKVAKKLGPTNTAKRLNPNFKRWGI